MKGSSLSVLHPWLNCMDSVQPASRGGALPFVALARTDMGWLAENVVTPLLGGPGALDLVQHLGAVKAVLTLEPTTLHLHTSVAVDLG